MNSFRLYFASIIFLFVLSFTSCHLASENDVTESTKTENEDLPGDEEKGSNPDPDLEGGDDNQKKYKTENVIVIVVDGARFSETWGGSLVKAEIPYQKLIAKQGVLYVDFRNNGATYTNAGHSAITTGHYQEIENVDGDEFHQFFNISLNKKALGVPTLGLLQVKRNLISLPIH